MHFSTLLLSFLTALAAAAPSPAKFTDPKTSITFSTISDATSGYTFGVALPMKPSTDFIGILSGKGTGWSGVSLGGGMLNKLLIVAWPSSGKVIGSFRKATSYGSPAEATGTFKQTPIAAVTFANATHWSYTFLCSNCIATDGTTFKAADASGSVGWALNTAAPATPASASTTFSRHSSQGQAKVDLSGAKSMMYSNWSMMAKMSVAGRVRLA